MSESASMGLRDAADNTRELQDRVARYARTVLVISVVLGLASVGTHWATRGHASESGGVAHELVHAATLLPAILAWLRCRGRPLSARQVQTVEVALTVVACLLYALLGMSAVHSLSVTFSVLLAMTYTLLGRSILVPSSRARTAWVSSAGALPAIVYFTVQGVPAAFAESLASRFVFSAFGVLWCLFAIFASVANSQQLYGLRAHIREMGKLGQYTLEEKIGEGGMGVVYRATHAMLRRPAAVKLLSKERASEKDQARFEREVQLTSRLTHPNTISIFDYGRTSDGVFYYAMEYLDGLDLDRLVKEGGPLSPARAIHVLLQVCSALGEAHAHGLIHRDIKPANIVLTKRVDEPDVVKVVDFGLVKTLAQADGDSGMATIIGTPMYLAPESILKPETVDARADIYALGAVAYFLLAGRDVFEGATTVEVISRHLLEQPVAPSLHLERPLPGDLEAVVLRCLAKDRNDRPSSALELREELMACDDATRYDRTAAFAWWQSRVVGAPLGTGVGASPATLAVDFHGRNAAG